MDDFLKKNDGEPQQNLTNEIKKIEFKFIKEKRCSRTYILNLEFYIQDPTECTNLMKKIRKALGTSYIYADTIFGPGHGFNGDFGVKIKAYLIDNHILSEDVFK